MITANPSFDNQNNQDLEQMYQEIITREITSVVVQFNYGFFDFNEFSIFLNKLFLRKIKVIIFLHSTIDPKLNKDKSLSLLTSKFSLCDRILVHSPNDLNRLKLNGLINNVGIAGPTKFIEKITKEEWQNTIETNLNSHFFFTKFAIPLLKKNKSGSIINLSSTAGLFGFPQRTPYASSKWAIIGLTKSLAMELGKFRIRVNAICPGSVEGDRMKRVISAKAKLLKINSNKIQKEFESMTSIKSFVSKEDIASMVVYLLSDSSINISGQAIAVDGHTERMN